MKRKLKIGALALLIIVTAAFTRPGERYFEIAKSIDIFSTLFKEVNSYYVDEIDPEKLVNTGIGGMLESLDPYTDFIPEESMEAFSIQTTGQYAGIGALVGLVNKRTVITHPYEGFAAYRAGLHVGDEFISVDGKDVKGKPTSEVSEKLKGKAFTEVEVVVRRNGKDLTFRLTREKIKISNVAYQGIIAPGVGYIKLDDFTPGAAKEVEEALVQLKKLGAERLILDLRDNPGGLLYEAVNIVNLFVPVGKEVVSTRGKVQEWNKTYSTLNNAVDTGIPLVVLTSGGSASASEIVAGSLQDYDRAVLVGQKTFGKGLVQVTRPLSYNTQLKVTTAKYYIPSGRCIQAIDYTHRKGDGTVDKVADSLKSAFKTKSGRQVFDGGGLDPDILVKEEHPGSVVVTLARAGYLFDFATKYCNEHAAPADIRSFRLSDADYGQFSQWLQDQNFTFSTQLEKVTHDFEEAASKEPNHAELQKGIDQIRATIKDNKVNYMTKFRGEIQPILESEIGFHYLLNKGRVESSLDHDSEVKEAVKILNNLPAYQKLLLPH
ncbi:MAG: S41 family peptidase [Bacteroidetes bacterium]|nr:S41 family peptidase [Bacteroidota bacterium]